MQVAWRPRAEDNDQPFQSQTTQARGRLTPMAYSAARGIAVDRDCRHNRLQVCPFAQVAAVFRLGQHFLWFVAT